MRKQWTVEVKESMHSWPNEAIMNQWIKEWVNSWVNESVIRWINETMNQWMNESMNESTNKRTEIIDDSMIQRMNHWTGDLVSRCISESNQWTNDSANQWIVSRWISESVMKLLFWATSSLSDRFAEVPLLSATSAASYLGYFFSDPALGCLSYLFCRQPNSSLHAAVKVHFATATFSCNSAEHKNGWCSETTFRAAVTMPLETPSCNPE